MRRALDSEEALKELALNYLARFPTTTERMRKYLGDKVRDAVKRGEIVAGSGRAWIDGVIATLLRVRLLDDAAYAELRARTLHRRGRAERFIERDLTKKKADAGAIETAMKVLGDEVPQTDLVAAIRLAKKKRLGPFAVAALKTKPGEHERDARMRLRNRHMGTLARSGFGFEIARIVLDARDVDALEALVEGAAS